MKEENGIWIYAVLSHDLLSITMLFYSQCPYMLIITTRVRNRVSETDDEVLKLGLSCREYGNHGFVDHNICIFHSLLN